MDWTKLAILKLSNNGVVSSGQAWPQGHHAIIFLLSPDQRPFLRLVLLLSFPMSKRFRIHSPARNGPPPKETLGRWAFRQGASRASVHFLRGTMRLSWPKLPILKYICPLLQSHRPTTVGDIWNHQQPRGDIPFFGGSIRCFISSRFPCRNLTFRGTHHVQTYPKMTDCWFYIPRYPQYIRNNGWFHPQSKRVCIFLCFSWWNSCVSICSLTGSGCRRAASQSTAIDEFQAPTTGVGHEVHQFHGQFSSMRVVICFNGGTINCVLIKYGGVPNEI